MPYYGNGGLSKEAFLKLRKYGFCLVHWKVQQEGSYWTSLGFKSACTSI